jgi:hypothetical protein
VRRAWKAYCAAGALGAVLLSACADNKVAGATSETTNGDIKALIDYPNQGWAKGVRVYAVEDSGWVANASDGRSVILDSGITDGNGAVTLKVPLGRRFNLQAVAGDSGFLARDAQAVADTVPDIAPQKFHLMPMGRISGILRADSGMAENIRLQGTLCSALVSGDGQFSLAVPAGVHPVMAGIYLSETEFPALVKTVAVAPGEVLDSLNFTVSPLRVLVDDFEQDIGRPFEHGRTQTVLGRLVGAGRWFARSDILEGGDSRNEVELVADTQAFAGTSLRIRHILGPKLPFPYSNVGFYVGTATIKNKTFDFTDVKSISFMARGRGNLEVRFTSKAVSKFYADSVHFHTVIPLQAAWTPVTVPLSSLKVPDYAPAALKAWPWSRAAKEIAAIDFKANPPGAKAGDTVDVDLDDIYLEGVPLEHFLP